MASELRRLPSVDKVLCDEGLKPLRETYPHNLIVEVTRQRLEQERLAVISGKTCSSLSEIVDSVCFEVQELARPSLRPVINAAGVLLHTNLGRAPLSPEATAAMSAVSRGYCNLEFDLDSGERGSRNVHVEHLLCQLSGAEAALVVNNNAAGVMLGLTVLAKKKEVIVSRGQAVEIGGGFRVPDVMRQSGARLVEVGTTNCTYVRDYEEMITERTAALLKVHPSNFRVEGFTHSVSLGEMVALADGHGLIALDDLGSGCFMNTEQFGLEHEPTVQESVAGGSGLVFFSGDKLIGGPQAGIIVGKKALVDKLKRHPLARALRSDKIRLAGLAATLIHYLKGEAVAKVPVWRMMAAPLDEIERRARLWAQALGVQSEVIDGQTMLGGGSVPGGTLPTRLVAIGRRRAKGKGRNVALSLSRQLRHQEHPVIGRVSGDVLLLDPRCVLPEEDVIVIAALSQAAAASKP